MTTIFRDMELSKKEYGTHRDIEATRFADGSVNMVIGSWAERNDKTVRGYHLSAENAEKFGRALLCMEDDTFDDILTRAAQYNVETIE